MYGSYKIDGARLRQLRVERALSQQDLERKTGITQPTISNLEQGNRSARLSTIRKLSEALNVDPTGLMQKSDRRGKPTRKRF